MLEPYRQEDPNTLSFVQYIQRASRLPLGNLLQRVIHFVLSMARNAVAVPQALLMAKRRGKRAHFIILPGRIGDIIAAEPVLELLKEPGDFMVWLCQQAYTDLLEQHLGIDVVIPVSSLTEALLLKGLVLWGKWSNIAIDGTLCNMFGLKNNNPNPAGINITNYYNHGCLADIYCLIAANQIAPRHPAVYTDRHFDAAAWLKAKFSDTNLPLLVLHLTSDEHARSWSKDSAAKLRNWLVEQGQFNIIELGKAPLMAAGSAIAHMDGLLPLNAQMEIIRHARLFAGVDSGFAHIANALAVPSILLLGSYRNFDSYLPVRPQENDVVIRSPDQVFRVKAEVVIDAILSYCGNGEDERK
jgi:heptosyltransferase III